jgi:uncharacterized protein (TIGR03067 family)
MRRVLPLVAVLCLAFAPAPFPKPYQSNVDFKKLQGMWVQTYLLEKGKRVKLPYKKIWLFEGDRIYEVFDDAAIHILWFSIDARSTQRNIYLRSSQNDPPSHFGRYRLAGDTLTLCISHKKRPDGLSGDEGKVLVWIWVRKRS